MLQSKLLTAIAAGAMILAANVASAAEVIVKVDDVANNFEVGQTYTSPTDKFKLEDSAVVPDPIVSILTAKVKNADNSSGTTGAGQIGELLGGTLTIDLRNTLPELVPSFLTIKASTAVGDVYAFSATAIDRVFSIVFDVALNTPSGQIAGISNIQILTPVPAALPLLLTAIGGLFGFRWFRRRQQDEELATA